MPWRVHRAHVPHVPHPDVGISAPTGGARSPRCGSRWGWAGGPITAGRTGSSRPPGGAPTGSLGKLSVQVILVRQPGGARPYDIALVTTDMEASAEQTVARYAERWPVEQSIKDGKFLLGAGDAENRLPAAVAPHRTVRDAVPIHPHRVVSPCRHRRDRPDHRPRRASLAPPQDPPEPRRHADRLPSHPNNSRLRSSPVLLTKPTQTRDLHRRSGVSAKLQQPMSPPETRATVTRVVFGFVFKPDGNGGVCSGCICTTMAHGLLTMRGRGLRVGLSSVGRICTGHGGICGSPESVVDYTCSRWHGSSPRPMPVLEHSYRLRSVFRPGLP